jgi:hypothetical protein
MRSAWALIGVAAIACGDDSRPASPDAQEVIDAIPPAFDASTEPTALSETGLYSDIEGKILAPGVEPYRPAFPLWSDGAEKARWVHLPEGSSIDTSDMDFWSYPVGTRLWKEFSLGGQRLETRFLWKRGPGDWYSLAYVWNDAESDALAAPDGERDVRGTAHDVPGTDACDKCHGRQPDRVLGFTAVQLAHQEAGINLPALVADGRLSDDPAGASPYFGVPGTGNGPAAVGLLHGNCGGCHHRESDVMDMVSVNLRLEVASLASLEETSTYQSAVGVKNQLVLDGVTALIEPGDAGASAIYVRMNLRGGAQQMPPLGTEEVDGDGLAVLAAWIDELAP